MIKKIDQKDLATWSKWFVQVTIIRAEDKQQQNFDQAEIGHRNNFGLKVKFLILQK